MSLGFSLDMTMRGLLSTTSRLNLVSQNITNAGKEGYTRKEATDQYVTTNFGVVPVKTNVSGSTDRYLTKSVVTDGTNMGYNRAISQILEYYSTQLGATDGSSTMSSQLNDLYGTLQQLSVSPETLANKTEAVQNAANLANSLRNLSVDIQEMREQADQKIAGNVSAINDSLQKIYEINSKIIPGSTSASQMAEFEDQRMLALETLSQNIDIQYYFTSHNQLQVFTGSGLPLITTTQPQKLTYEPAGYVNSATIFQPISLNGIDITSLIKGGELGGNITVRDSIMVEEQAKLDEFADVLKTQMNTLLNKGSSLPPQPSMTGTLRNLTTATTITPISGTLRVALVDNAGVLQNYADVNLAGMTNVGDLITALNGVPNISASLNADGALVVASTLTGSGVALNEMNSSVGAGGVGASMYFGLQDLFTGNSASSLIVKPSLSSNQNYLATGTLSSGAIAAGDNVITRGDGSTALAMSQILKANVPFDAAGNFSAQSNTLNRYVEAIIADGATKAKVADNQYETSNLIYSQTKETLNNKSGVNIDEETTKMLELQNAYETSARLISTIRDMFQALLSAVN